jgi:signal transduction histidine kinase
MKRTKNNVSFKERALLLFITMVASAFLIVFADKTNNAAFQWLLMSILAIGVYSLSAKLLSYFKPNPIQRLRQKMSEMIYTEMYEKSGIPTIIFNLESFKVEAINENGLPFFQMNLQDHDFQLSCLFKEKDYEEIQSWLAEPGNADSHRNLDTQMFVANRLNRLVLCPVSLTIINIVGDASNNFNRLAYLRFYFKEKSVNTLTNNYNYNYKYESNWDDLRFNSSLAYWELDVRLSKLYFSDQVAEIMKLDQSFSSPMYLIELKGVVDTSVYEYILSCTKQLGFGNNEDSSLAAQKVLTDRKGNQKFLQINAKSIPQSQVVIGTFFDMTHIKEAENKLRQQEQQVNQLIDSIPESILVFQNSRVVFRNQAANSQFKVDSSQRLSLSKIISESDKSLIHDRIKFMLAGKKRSYGFTSVHMKRFDEKLFEAEIAMNMIMYKGVESIQLVIRDLSDVLRVKNALSRANQRLSALSSRTLELIETERRQIAGELHDDVGQSLTAIILAMNWLGRRTDADELRNKIEDVHQIASQSLDTVRNISLLLRPSQLDTLGFAAAIKWQLERLLTVSNIIYTYNDDDFSEITDKQAEIVGFRVVQESLTNIVKHAKAKNVDIVLKSTINNLTITIADDGEGFNVNEQSESVGLINMKERIELANGDFTIESKPQLGTKIKVEIPLLQSTKANEIESALRNEQ